MKPVSKNTARWADIVSAECDRQGLPFPPELILAVIDCESAGVPGIVNPSSGASGLMQVMPIALDHYNKFHPLKFSIADLRSKENPVSQIRVGTWLLGQFWRSAHAYLSKRMSTIPIDDLARIADLMFAAGPGAVRKKLDKLPVPNWDAIVGAYPAWNAIPHPNRVFNRVLSSAISETAVNQWIATSAKSSISPRSKMSWLTTAILSTLVGVAIHYLLRRFQS